MADLAMVLAADLLEAMRANDLVPQRVHPAVPLEERERALAFWLRHGVAGLVTRVYAPDSLALALGEQGLAHLRRRATGIQRQALLLLSCLRDVLRLAAGIGVPVIVFKGVADARDIYGDLGVRQASDLDVIVPVADVDRLMQALSGRGWCLRDAYADYGPRARRCYRAFNHALVLQHKASGVCLDLHWRVNEFALLDINEECWVEARSEPAILAGEPCLRLRPMDRYLALLSHAARSEFGRLRWWTDLVRARQMAVSVAGEEGLAAALRAAGATDLDARWRSACQRLADAKEPVTGEPEYWLLRDTNPTPREQLLLRWRLRGGAKYRVSLVLHECIRWDDLKQFPMPDIFFPLYFVLRGPLMVARRLRQLRSSTDAGHDS